MVEHIGAGDGHVGKPEEYGDQGERLADWERGFVSFPPTLVIPSFLPLSPFGIDSRKRSTLDVVLHFRRQEFTGGQTIQLSSV